MMPVSRGRPLGLLLSSLTMMILLGSCTRLLGWGVLLWSSEDPPVPSGTVLPVYIQSNIDGVWVVGIPEAFRQPENPINKYEIPLAQLEFLGSRSKARERAAAFSGLALSYAETLQDGLPIRESPDNGARRVYRLRLGEIIKLLEQVKGNPAISTTGAPLPGEWYRVLTEDGSTGYCFSYRLRIFEHGGGRLAAVQMAEAEEEDPELERVLSKTWSPEWYGTMVNSRQLDLEALSRHWNFSPGIDTGLAHIYLPTLDRTFPYTGIRSAGTRAWRFEGAPLQMNLRSDTTLAVQYTEEGGALRTLLFVALPSGVDDLIVQETTRREELYDHLYTQGPAYTSTNYGTLSFKEEGRFNWTGYELLVPRIIPPSAPGNGWVSMDLFLAPSLADRYEGAFSLLFDGIGDAGTTLRFMYTLDNQGFRIEYVPPENMEGATVLRRASSPTVIYFFRAEQPLPAEARSGPGAAPTPSPSPAPEPPRRDTPEPVLRSSVPAWEDPVTPELPAAEPPPEPVPETPVPEVRQDQDAPESPEGEAPETGSTPPAEAAGPSPETLDF